MPGVLTIPSCDHSAALAKSSLGAPASDSTLPDPLRLGFGGPVPSSFKSIFSIHGSVPAQYIIVDVQESVHSTVYSIVDLGYHHYMIS